MVSGTSKTLKELWREGVKILGRSEDGEKHLEDLAQNYEEDWRLYHSSVSLAALEDKFLNLASGADHLAAALREVRSDDLADRTFLKNTKGSREIWGRAGGDHLMPMLLEGRGFGIYSAWEATSLPREANILDLYSLSEITALAELARYWASHFAALQKGNNGRRKASATLLGAPNQQLAVDCAMAVFVFDGDPDQAGRLMWIVMKTVRKAEIKDRSAERERKLAVRLAKQLVSHRPPSQ